MNKVLEALEKLTNYKCSCTSEKLECKKIIENALKELEQHKALENELGVSFKELCLFLKEGFSIEWNGKNVVAHSKKP